MTPMTPGVITKAEFTINGLEPHLMKHLMNHKSEQLWV